MNSPSTPVDDLPENRRLRIQDITLPVRKYGYVCNYPGCGAVVVYPEGTGEYQRFMILDYHIEGCHPEDPKHLQAWAQMIRDRPEVEPQDRELTQLMTFEERMKLFESEPHCHYLSKLERKDLLQPDREYATCLACGKTIMLDGRYAAYISAFKTHRNKCPWVETDSIWTEIRRELRERDFFRGAVSDSRQRRVLVDTQKPTGRIVAPAACWPGGERPEQFAGKKLKAGKQQVRRAGAMPARSERQSVRRGPY